MYDNNIQHMDMVAGLGSYGAVLQRVGKSLYCISHKLLSRGVGNDAWTDDGRLATCANDWDSEIFEYGVCDSVPRCGIIQMVINIKHVTNIQFFIVWFKRNTRSKSRSKIHVM